MKKLAFAFTAIVLITLSGAVQNSTEVELNILTQSGQRNKTAPLLYGWMFEDINHSGDGGIYAELLANRAFQGEHRRSLRREIN